MAALFRLQSPTLILKDDAITSVTLQRISLYIDRLYHTKCKDKYDINIYFKVFSMNTVHRTTSVNLLLVLVVNGQEHTNQTGLVFGTSIQIQDQLCTYIYILYTIEKTEGAWIMDIQEDCSIKLQSFVFKNAPKMSLKCHQKISSRIK